MSAAPPRLIATAGLHGSASTWVFNVARALLIDALGEAQVVSLYAERAEELPLEQPGALAVLVKTHQGGASLDAKLEQAAVVLSIRDPRDAAISMAQRFGAPLARAAGWLAADCERMARLTDGRRLLLRYEDRFFDDPAAPGRVARALGLAPSPETLAEISARFTTGAVRDFARAMDDLQPGRVHRANGVTVDTVTQIHRTHIGDARTGKWRDLPPEEREGLTAFFHAFLDCFGYAACST